MYNLYSLRDNLKGGLDLTFLDDWDESPKRVAENYKGVTEWFVWNMIRKDLENKKHLEIQTTRSDDNALEFIQKVIHRAKNMGKRFYGANQEPKISTIRNWERTNFYNDPL